NNNNNNDNIDNGIGENIIEKSEQTIEDGKYIIKTLVNKNFALDITGASTYDRANVQLWSDVSVLQQRFEVEYLPDGYYKITNIKSGKVLDVQDANTKIGANLQQFMWHDVDAQKWIIEKTDDGYYSIKSKLSGLYIDLYNGVALNGQNIHLFSKNNTNAQKFEFERTGTQTIQNGLYTIHTTVNNGFVVDVSGASQENRANVQVWESNGTDAQKFKFIYNERGYYTIKAKHSNKVLDVADGSFNIGTNVHQYEENKTDAQKWIIEKNNDNYSFISKLNGLYFDIYNGVALNGQNIHLFTQNGTNAQLFKLEKTSSVPNLDTSRYPGYLERINNTIDEFSGWEIEFVYTGLNYWDAVNGEYSLRKRNLVPKSYGAYSPWVADDDKTLYDTGWYPASREAIAYQMDPRNFLDSTNIFQFLYVNQFCEDAVSINGISDRVSGKFLQGYEYDIYNACKNTNVDPYYVIARLIQEGGGSTLRMERSEGTYYNPFNIGASGDGTWNVINNAYNTARNNGWDTMQKAIEGGIQFLKNNYLECYQNTLYTNKFDIDRRSGGLYTHQYMQNLFAAYNEARNLCSYYRADNKLDSNFKFIIPLYEEMPSNPTPNPNGVNLSDTICNYTAYIKTRDGDGCYIRSGPGTSYSAIGGYPDGTSLTVIDNKTYLNTNGYDWFRVVLNNGTQGYIPSKFLS
ncbi:MAG: RICIN domain-containing protein, partial [Clostridia bacterium]|nr:RICIN domain-containing protein [Clostridia bacterium]